jgi:hypothetical protein
LKFVPLKRLAWPLLLLLLAVAGCRREESVESYTVEHPDRQKLRLLGALVPHGDKTFVFKLSGPDAAVAAQKANFDKLLASLKFDDTKDPPVQWTLPDGWKEEPGNGQFRVATLRIDAKPPLEVPVTSFAGKVGSVLANVNRWRGQLTLPPVDQDELDRSIERRKLNGNAVTVVDVTGVGTYTPPGRSQTPAGHPPIGDRPPLAAGKAKKPPFVFEDVPKTWKKQEPPAPLSVESYEINDGNKKARVTISVLGGQAGGVAANAARWRQQIGLPAADPLQGARTLTVAGKEATFVDLDNPGSAKADNRILGVILPVDGATLFFKMTGPSDLVGREKANFETFAKSFKIEAR